MPDAIDLELLELLSKLGTLQQVVGGVNRSRDQENAVTADGKIDHFIVIRNQMTFRLSNLKETLDLKCQLEKSPGSNPKELITAQSKIRTELATLQEEFKELETIYNTETKKKRSKFTPDEMKSRQQMLMKIQMEIEGIKEVKRSGYVKGYQGIQLVSMENHEIFKAGADKKSGRSDWADNGQDGEGGSRGVYGNRNNNMTAEHKMQLHQLKERDAQIDDVILDIGHGVDELHALAREANEEVKLQNKMLDTLESKIDNVHEQVTNINSKLKTSIDKARKSDKICCDIFCILLLIGMIIIVVKVSDDNKKKK